MNKDMIEKMLLNNARKAIFDSIDNINDVDFLKKELKYQLRENFNLYNQLEEKNKLIDDVIKIIKKEYFVEYNGELIKKFLFDTPYEILEILERGKND